MEKSAQELLERALAGDRAAMRHLVAHVLAPTIEARLARRLALAGASRQELADHVQEALVHLLDRDAEALRRWDPRRGAIEPYVATVAENLLASRLRKKPPPRPVEDVDATASSARETPEEDASFTHLVRRLLREMNDDDAALFRAVFMEELSPEEAAARLQISLDAAYKRVQRLRARLREMMSNTKAPSA